VPEIKANENINTLATINTLFIITPSFLVKDLLLFFDV
jgi:hypothetical protein